ncbi:protein phosphatase 1 regulatory subunit 15B [Stegostoma tigrinum]|uniref:protein phosphatase 1 regulatory subunit 15B n=1 Tax=Stegostoma tigrinum TaxID=3053191 RepID=UPI002870A774|nr:protein phosphatase 1 regulatory subunit 15B [Stegostoma tigrinum]
MFSVAASLSVLGHFGVAVMGTIRDFFGLSLRLPTVLRLCSAVLNQLIKDSPLSNSQFEDVKEIGKKLLFFPWFGRVNTTCEKSGLESVCKQQEDGTIAQLNSSKFNQQQINSKGPYKSSNTTEDNLLQSTERNCSQRYLTKSNQNHFERDNECVAINHLSCHCMIPKHSVSPSDWNKMMNNGEDYNSMDSEEWEDSEEDSEMVCSSDDSFSDESDQELNDVPWKCSFSADTSDPLNFTACRTSSSTNRKASVDLNTQGLGKCESGRKSLIKVKLSISQKPVLRQIRFRHSCIPNTGEEVRFCTKEVSAKSVKAERKDNKVEKTSVKKVRFSPLVEVHKMVTWSFASREARKGHWMQIALDRIRFLHRIQATEDAISYCLQQNHRNKILKRNSEIPKLRDMCHY